MAPLPPPPSPAKFFCKKQEIAAVITAFLAICPPMLPSPKKKKTIITNPFLFSFTILVIFLSLLLYHSSLRRSCDCHLLLAAIAAATDDGAAVFLPLRPVSGNLTLAETEFWRQPDGNGYLPCVKFSLDYRKASAAITAERRRFLMVVVSGSLSHQRNQIIDAVVMARVLRTALIIPILQVSPILGDESEFGDIFDIEYFKKTLRAHVRVLSSLPSTHLASKRTIVTRIPADISPQWLRARFSKTLREEGLVVLKGLDSKLSKCLPPDLQKLRCKVAFDALRFATPIRHIGNMIARRMWADGPYVALHAGLCTLEMVRVLKALGAPRSARVYPSGGVDLVGGAALGPLIAEFPNTETKETLARVDELSAYVNRSLSLAAIDYLVALSSNVFIWSHGGGGMARAIQGHRTYTGHRKTVIWIHGLTRYQKWIGAPLKNQDADVTVFPVPECMCKNSKL